MSKESREREREKERGKQGDSPEAYENRASEEAVHTSHLLLKVCVLPKK